MMIAGFARTLSLLGIAVVVTLSSARADVRKTTDTFCGDLQRTLFSTTVPAATMVHPDFRAFVKSKASLNPLRVEQFVLYGDEAAKKDPLRLSCKLKTPDVLTKEYGPNAAKEPSSCNAVNQDIFAAARKTLGNKAKLPESKVQFHTIDTQYGATYVAPFTHAAADPDGTLHITAKQLRINWSDEEFAVNPDNWRGVFYCHLVAPEYAQRLLAGETPAASGEK